MILPFCVCSLRDFTWKNYRNRNQQCILMFASKKIFRIQNRKLNLHLIEKKMIWKKITGICKQLHPPQIQKSKQRVTSTLLQSLIRFASATTCRHRSGKRDYTEIKSRTTCHGSIHICLSVYISNQQNLLFLVLTVQFESIFLFQTGSMDHLSFCFTIPFQYLSCFV